MKIKASASKNAADEDEAEPKKIRSSRSKRRRGHRSSSSGSESMPHKRSKKHSKRIPEKKSKRSKVSSSSRRRRRRSLSPSHSLSSSSSPSSIARHSCSTFSSSTSERSVSPPPRSRSRDVRKKKGRGRDRERGRKRRKARRSASSSSSSSSSGSSSSSRSRSKSKHRKRRTVAGSTRDKVEIDYDNRYASQSEEYMAEDDDRDENKLAIAKKGELDIGRYKKNLESESAPSKNANETHEMAPAGGGNSEAEYLELNLRQKALENFIKFRAAAVMAGKTDTNGATGKEALIDGRQNADTEIAEVRSSAATHFQRQGSSRVTKNPAGSPRSEDCGNGTSHSWKQEGSAGVSRGTASPGILEAGDTCGPTEQKGRPVEATHSNCQFRSPQDGKNSRSVMQRLGSGGGACHVNGPPRVRSVVSIPAREGLDGSPYTTPPMPSENSAPVESSNDVGCPLIDVNKAESINGDDRKTSEASTSSSILSPAEGKSQDITEDKDGAQFQKKTFSKAHDGETVEVSYKVYIPKKTPALARRKPQR